MLFITLVVSKDRSTAFLTRLFSSPPLCSLIISLSSVVGGIWFDLDTVPDGNFFKTICEVLPFTHAVEAARGALSGNYEGMPYHLLVCCAWAVAVFLLAVSAFNIKMKSEKK